MGITEEELVKATEKSRSDEEDERSFSEQELSEVDEIEDPEIKARLSLDIRRQAWEKGVESAVDHALKSKSVQSIVLSFLDVYAPKDKEKPKSLFSFSGIGLMFKAVGFAIRHPVHTYNLIKLARSPQIYNDNDFRAKVLNKDSLWDFVKGNADNLPRFGRAVGLKQKDEKALIDIDSLDTLKEAFKSENDVGIIKFIGQEIFKEKPLWNDVVAGVLELGAGNKNVKKYLDAKKDPIKDFVKDLNYIVTKADVDSRLRKLLTMKAFEEIKGKFDKNPALALELSRAVLAVYDEFHNKGEKDDGKLAELLDKELKNNPVLRAQLTESDLRKLTICMIGTTRPYMQRNLEKFRVDAKILDHIPLILDKVNDVGLIYSEMMNKPLFVWIEGALKFVNENPELKQFIIDNPKFIPDLAKGVIESTPSIKEITTNFKFDSQILDLMEILMKKPEVAFEIIQDLNKGDFQGLTDKLLIALNDPKLKGLAEKMSDQTSLFVGLTIGIFEQDKKDNQNKGTPEKSMEALFLTPYNITYRDLEKFAGILPLLLNKPKDLQTIFGQITSGNYLGLVQDVLLLMENDEKIKNYVTGKEDKFFPNFIVTIAKGYLEKDALEKGDKESLKSKFLNAYGIEAKDIDRLFEIFPILLDNPKDLNAILDLFKTGKYTEMGAEVLSIAATNPKLKVYMDINKDIFAKIVKSQFKGVDEKVVEIIPELFKKADQLKELIPFYEKGDWYGLIIKTCDMLENNPSLPEYLRNNQENFEKIIVSVFENEKNVDLRNNLLKYTTGLEIADLASLIKNPIFILQNPKIIKGFVEEIQKGNYLGLSGKIIDALNDQSFKGFDKIVLEEKQIFVELAKGYFAQDKAYWASKNEPQNSIEEKFLKPYGLIRDDFDKLAEVLPLLINNPAVLKKVFDNLTKGKYMDMAQDIIELSKTDPNVLKFMQDNKDIFSKVVKSQFKGVSEGFADIIPLLISKPDMLNSFIPYINKGDYLGLGIKICEMLESDKEFKDYFNAHQQDFENIVNQIVKRVPAVRNIIDLNLRGIEVGGLVAKALVQNPAIVKEALINVSKGNYTTLGKLVVQSAYADKDFKGLLVGLTGGVKNVLFNVVIGKDYDLATAATKVIKSPSTRDKEPMVNLEEFLIQKVTLTPENKSRLTEYIAVKSFGNTNIDSVTLERFVIRDYSFINSTINGMVIKDCELIGTSFANTTLVNVRIEGSTIDGNSLRDLIPALQSKSVSLANRKNKLVGDISGLDLSGVNLEGVDLSGVTSLKGANLSGANLTNTNINPDLLKEAFGLESCELDIKQDQDKYAQLLKEQKGYVVSRVVDLMVDEKDKEAKADKGLKDALLASKYADYLIKFFESKSSELSGDVKIDKSKVNHIVDYKGKVGDLLEIIKSNKNSLEKLDDAIAAMVVADAVVEKLWGVGSNRGKDGLRVRDMLIPVLLELSKVNPEFKLSSLVKVGNGILVVDGKLDIMINEVYQILYQNTSYTKAAGTYLPNLTEEKVAEIQNLMKEACVNNLNLRGLSTEMLSIKDEMAAQIAYELFQEGSKGAGARVEDAKRINKLLDEVLSELVSKHGDKAIIQSYNENKQSVIGKMQWGTFSSNGTGLTGIIYKCTKSTSAGFVSGGIYLPAEKIDDKLKNEVKEVILDKLIKPNLSKTDRLELERDKGVNSQRTL